MQRAIFGQLCQIESSRLKVDYRTGPPQRTVRPARKRDCAVGLDQLHVSPPLTG